MLARKLRGKRFGFQLRSKSWQRKISAMGRAALVTAANEHAEAHRPRIDSTTGTFHRYRGHGGLDSKYSGCLFAWGSNTRAACRIALRQLALRRTRDLLRECRLGAARRTQVHKRMNWRIDHRSAIRLRIHAIWARIQNSLRRRSG
jgi:hypothetical protein